MSGRMVGNEVREANGAEVVWGLGNQIVLQSLFQSSIMIYQVHNLLSVPIFIIFVILYSFLMI
jgi:hypothetical protein